MTPNLYLKRINDFNLLSKDGGFALNIGSGDGRDSQFLSDLGYAVTSVDKESHPGVVVTDIRDFIIEPKRYSFITANNVLPFLPSKAETYVAIINIVNGLKKGGLVHFTVFGPKSDIKAPTHFSYNEILDFVAALDVEIVEAATRDGIGQNMKGDVIHSHVHSFLLKK